MALLLTAALASTALASPAASNCSWDRPGHDPFRGDVVTAVDRYADIPPEVRAQLKARMARHDYDEVVEIRRDRIQGQATYDPVLRDMHFGRGRMCHQISRVRWTDDMVERGLVYCEATHCVIVPTVCNNVSRITRLGLPGGAHMASGPGGDGSPVAQAPADGQRQPQGLGDELVFEPPGAGPSFTDGVLADPASLDGFDLGGFPGLALGAPDPDSDVGGPADDAQTVAIASPDDGPLIDLPPLLGGGGDGRAVPGTDWSDPGIDFGPGLPGLNLPSGGLPAVPELASTWLWLGGLAALGAWRTGRSRAAGGARRSLRAARA